MDLAGLGAKNGWIYARRNVSNRVGMRGGAKGGEMGPLLNGEIYMGRKREDDSEGDRVSIDRSKRGQL